MRDDPATTATENRPALSMNQVEAARALGISDRTLRRWEKRKLIVGRRVGGGVRLYPIDRLRELAGAR